MKTLLRSFLACCLPAMLAPAAHAQLTAAAGPDVILCQAGMSGFPADTPAVGGTPAASGGTAPYTYLWTVLDMYPASYYLSDITDPNPELIAASDHSDSVLAILQVTDAAGATDYDTTVIRFQTLICLAVECYYSKHPADTITISPTCFDPFLPITFAWSPTDGLVDPTAAMPEVYTPTTTEYTGIATDAYGCPYIAATCSVVVTYVGIEPGQTSVRPAVFAAGDGNIYTDLPPGCSMVLLTVADVTGRVLLRQKVAAGKNIVPLSGSLTQGIYYYRLEGTGEGQLTGRIFLH